MRIAEDTEKGLMAKALDDSGENILRFGRMKYDARYGWFRSDCALSLDAFVSAPTKAQAVKLAAEFGFSASHVERIGSRFWSAWGIRHDLRDKYFMTTYS